MTAWGLFVARYSVQIAVVVAAAALGNRLLNPPLPRIGLAWWRGALGVCLILPLWPARLADAAAATLPVVAARIVSGTAPPHAASIADRWPAALLWIIVAGAFARAVWLAVGVRHLRRLRRSGSRAPLDGALEDLRRTIAPDATVRWHASIDQPVTFGLRRPIVLLPIALADCPADVQRAVVCHELLHAARRDWAWAMAEEAVRTLFWFHPAMRWVLVQLQLAREAVVDALSVAISGSRRSYVDALLVFADRPALARAMPFAHRRHLVRRVAQLTQEVDMSRQRIAAGIAAASIVTVASAWMAAAVLPVRTAARPVKSDVSASTGRDPSQSNVPGAKPIHVLSQTKAAYPAEALPYDVEAAVWVNVTIAADGQVADARTAKWRLTFDHEIEDPNYWASHPERAFADAAEAAALKWTFAPLERDVACVIEFSFRNRKDGEPLRAAPPASTGVKILEGTTVGGRRDRGGR
jgi:beta-lactamase regulating signal transducer with metallopeptidase domain